MSVAAVPRRPEDELANWRALVLRRVADGARFAGLHATDRSDGCELTALLAVRGGIEPVDVLVPAPAGSYPALSPDLPAASWYERAIHDLFGVRPQGHPRLDPLLLPLDEDPAARPRPGSEDVPEPLVPTESALPSRVTGPGLFTIPHGPVRSGVFESVEYLVETPGEDIAHVQIRPYYKHRGVEKRFDGMQVDDGVLLAERVEGVASVAHALAFCHAIEDLTEMRVPSFPGQVRVLHAELERIANHLDVAMRLADAAGLAVATARFGWHKERVMRLVSGLCGNRFGRGVVVPGGMSAPPRLAAGEVLNALRAIEMPLQSDVRSLMRTPSFLDRLRGTGPLSAEVARTHGALGPVGRACGVFDDDRTERPYDGYVELRLPATPSVLDAEPGDAMARLRVRWDEVTASFQLMAAAVERMRTIGAPSQVDVAVRHATTSAAGRGIGWAEAPQGEVVYAVEVGAGRISRCAPRSASFHNLMLFHDVFRGDVLTDFPFIEASFGLSIAGVAM